MQSKKAAPHYRMTEERAHWEYEQGFSTVTGYIYHLVKATRRDGHKFRIDNVAQFCKERGISRAGFYKAIANLRKGGHIAAETQGSFEIWIDDSAVYESEQLSTKVDTLPVYENRQVSTNVDCESTKVDTVSTNVDKKSTIVDTRSPKPASVKASSAPSTIIQLNNSLTDQEREGQASRIGMASQSESDHNLQSTTAIAVQGKAPLQSTDELGSRSESPADFSRRTKKQPPRDHFAERCEPLDPWRLSRRKFDFVPDFVDYILKQYLPTLSCYEGKAITIERAQAWINEAEYDNKRHDNTVLQWNAFERYQQERAERERQTQQAIAASAVTPAESQISDKEFYRSLTDPGWNRPSMLSLLPRRTVNA